MKRRDTSAIFFKVIPERANRSIRRSIPRSWSWGRCFVEILLMILQSRKRPTRYGSRLIGSWPSLISEDGKPKANTVTSLFNEYYLLADLIREAQLQKRGGSDLIRFQDLPKWKNEGVTLLSDWRKVPHCSFLIQFPFYLSHEGVRDPDFAEFVRAQAVADQGASMRWNGIPCYWGNGAGTLPGGVYRANLYSEKSRLAGAANRSDRLLLDALWVGRQSSKIGDEVLCGRDTIHLPCDQRVTLKRASSLHDCPLIRRRSDSFWQS